MIEIQSERRGITQRQRWGHYFALFYAAAAIVIGLNLREGTLNAATPYSNEEAGIRALYPSGWLIDSDGPYVFRVRDLSTTGFQTTIQVAIQPIAATTSMRNVVDALTLSRAQQFDAYTPLERTPFTLSAEREALALDYAYVASGENVFLQTLPVVVTGKDVIVIQRNQAIIVTFLSDRATFDQNYPIFQRFLNDLVF